MANKRQPKVEPIQKIEKKEKAPEAPILSNSDFNTIKFTDSQLKFFRSISDNFLTVCTGPAGCLTKKEKIKVYIMKTKTDSRNVHKETNNPGGWENTKK